MITVLIVILLMLLRIDYVLLHGFDRTIRELKKIGGRESNEF
jgi:hypothetical protein